MGSIWRLIIRWKAATLAASTAYGANIQDPWVIQTTCHMFENYIRFGAQARDPVPMRIVKENVNEPDPAA